MKYSFRGIWRKMKNIFFFWYLNFIAYVSHQYKKFWWQRKDIFWQRNSVNFDKQYFLLIKQKQEKFKTTKTYLNELQKCMSFLELLLTDIFQHYLWVNATAYIDFYKLITWFVIHLILLTLLIMQHTLIISSLYWYLQLTTLHAFHFYK